MDLIKKILLSKENLLSYLGGIIFLAVFIWGYSYIDNNWYEYRDDGVITMSTAKNLVDVGFIGVSVSGPIVEASSSPMQFFTYTLAYFFTSVDYADYSYWQTIVSTFFIGFLFIRFFADKPIVAIILTTISAVGLTYFYPFFEWHASGMENAITHLLFLTTVYILYKSVKDNNINFWLAIIVFFATIARLDSVYHISILLVVYTVYWTFTYKNLKAFYFSLTVLVLWILFQLWRHYYFGDFLPNTAYAQNISIGDRIYNLLTVDQAIVWQSFFLVKRIFIKQAGWLLFVIPPLIYYFKATKNNVILIILTCSIILTSTFNSFLFGLTRIDPARTTTQMTVMVFLLISIMFYATTSKKKASIALVLLFPFIIIFYNSYGIRPYYLGWSTNGFNNTRIHLMKISKDNEIDRPTISTADLGVMTWYKELNNIDLGLLGSPIMAKLKNGPMMTEYYLNYGLPDIIEAHGSWIDKYCNSIFTKDKFNKLYSQIDTKYNMEQVCSKKKQLPNIYWIRNDIAKDSNSSERIFINDLQNKLSVERIKKEISTCNSVDFNCSYIARTVYKFLPELRDTNKFEKVYLLFNLEVDKALLRGWKDGQAHEIIIDAIKAKKFHNNQQKNLI